MLRPPNFVERWEPVRVICGDGPGSGPSEEVSRALLQTRALVYTAHPLDDLPGSPGVVCNCDRASGCERHLSMECELICETATHCLMIEDSRTGAHRVYVRDSSGFEGTVACECESLGDGQWLVTLAEHAQPRDSGPPISLARLVYPVRMCFCSRGRSPTSLAAPS